MDSEERRIAAFRRRARGRKVIVHYAATFYPYKRARGYQTSGSVALSPAALDDLGTLEGEMAVRSDLIGDAFENPGLAGVPGETEIDVDTLEIELQ
jgi:hypothetical protein